MKNGTVTEQNVKVNIPLLFKVNADKREVEGIATQEVTDVHGEIIDHESMKAVLADWPGNIREMHQPKAVGKAIKVVSDDDAKATILRARVSKGAPDTWEKVQDGTLSMFSIGGSGKRVTKKTAGGADEVRIYMSALHEVSLVDNGACPTAKFELVKSVDGQSVECQPEEPVEAPPVAKVTVLGGGREGLLALLAKAVAGEIVRTPKAQLAAKNAVAKLETVPADAVIKGAYPECYDINSALSAIACLESLMASEWYEAREEAINGEDDDAQTAQAQLAMLRQAINLVLQFLVSEFDEQFSEFDEADAAAELVIDNRADTRQARIADVIQKSGMFPALIGETVEETVEKKGARHNKTDASKIQDMHDGAVALGATCSTEKAAGAAIDVHLEGTTRIDPKVIAKVATEIAAAPALTTKTDTSAPVAAIAAADVQKLIADGIAAALTTQKATHDEAIAGLTARVEKLAASPRPGGPVARAVAVDKTLAGTASAAAGDIDPAQVLTFATELAKNAKTDDERQRIAENLIRFQMANGVGAVAFRSNSGRTEPPVEAGK